MLLSPSDPLDDAMEDLRVSGAVLLHEAYVPPWAIAIPDEERLRKLTGVGSDVRVAVFHFVRRASFELKVEGQDVLRIQTSEVVICPGGASHVMSHGIGGAPVPFDAILSGSGLTPAAFGMDGATELVCGVFFLRAAPLNPMLTALPPVLRVATNDVAAHPMLAGIADMLGREIDRGALRSYTAERLLEIFFAEAIRAYQRSEGSLKPGWLKGLGDARICEAIRFIHASPDEQWTVRSLAAKVALSPSRFAARFRETTGQSVMSYVSGWRVNVACRMMRDTDFGLTQIAIRVGYESLPAFSRAFKAQLGLPPTAWRLIAKQGG